MPQIELDLNKSIEENASVYFEKSKKMKKKLEGAKKAIEQSRKRLAGLEKNAEKEIEKERKKVEEKQKRKEKEKKKEWYEKFRWFVSSEGFLCVGGRDATTNEIIIKKHTDNNDIVFHTDMAGSPFFVVKVNDKKPGKATMQEAADATASYSKAWKLGLNTLDVFHVKPEQVSKKAKPGEYMAKGAFMIYGKTTYLPPNMELAIGLSEESSKVIGGPVDAVKKHSGKHIVISQGNEKAGALAKKIRKLLGDGDLDDIIRFLPSGGCHIVKS